MSIKGKDRIKRSLNLGMRRFFLVSGPQKDGNLAKNSQVKQFPRPETTSSNSKDNAGNSGPHQERNNVVIHPLIKPNRIEHQPMK